MLGDTFSITYNSVAKVLPKVAIGNYTATYYLDDMTNSMIFTASVKHTIPATGGSGESHLVRLDVGHFDADGVLLRTSSAWIVVRTDVGTQNSTDSAHTEAALRGWAGTATNMAEVIARES